MAKKKKPIERITANVKLCSCQKCPLHADYQAYKKNLVPTLERDPEVLFIGEAPGGQEADQGRPFVGRSGAVLANLLPASKTATITNVVMCRPPHNRTPRQKEVECCNAHLIPLIDQAKEIYLVGAVAFETVFKPLKFKNHVGTSFEWCGKKWHVVYHPAAAMHNPKLKLTLKRQYRAVREGRSTPSPLKPEYGEAVEKVSALILDTENDRDGNVLVGYYGDGGVVQEVV